MFKGVRGGVQDVAVKVLNISTPDAKERQAFEKVRPASLHMRIGLRDCSQAVTCWKE